MEITNKHPKIYLLSGKARNGKDTTAEFLKKFYEADGKKVIYSRAGKYIKFYASEMTGWDGKEETKPRQLLQELGREPTPEEIAKEMDMSVERVREILKISQEPVSLETPIGEEEDSHLGDFIQDDNVPVPAEAAAQTLLKEQLDEVLDTLTEREQKVLRLRFGMNDGRARTLEEVGREFDVTRERIRQIEAKALRKLRHPSRSRKLRDYLD